MQNRGKVTGSMGRNIPSHKNRKTLGVTRRNVSSKSVHKNYMLVSRGRRIKNIKIDSRKLEGSERKYYKKVAYVTRRNLSSPKEQKIKGLSINSRGVKGWKQKYDKRTSDVLHRDYVIVSKGKRIRSLKVNNSRKLKGAERECYKKIAYVVHRNVSSSKRRKYFVVIKEDVRKKRHLQKQVDDCVTIVKVKHQKNRGFVKDVALAAAKGEVESQEGGVELLDAAGTLKASTQGTLSLAKTTVQTGKTVYQSGKETAVLIGNTIANHKDKQETTKKPQLPVAKRDISRQSQPSGKMAGVRSREEYTERKNIHHFRKRPDGGKTKREESKSRDKQRKESIARKRMLTYIQNKTSQNPEKQDSIGNMAKDIVKGKVKQFGKNVATAFGKKVLFYLASAFGGLLVITMPIIVIVALFYSSPLAMFFPGDDNSETIQSVLEEYYTEFCNEVEKEKGTDGYDKITVKSATGEVDAEVSKSNYKDVLCVFAEKYGYDLQIADVSREVKESLKIVFDDMNYYSINVTTKTTTNKKGEQVQKKIKTITITQKNWKDMVEEYKFDKESKKELKELLAYANEFGIEGDEDEDYSSYAGTDVCIDGKVYDNPKSPIYKGSCAKIAKKTKNYIRPILKKKGMEPYIDIIVSMVQQESTFGKGDNANWMQVNGYDGEAGMASVKAGIAHFEGLLKKCETKKITDIKVLVQSYNFGAAYIDFAKENGGKDSLFLQESFQYKQSEDGHYGTRGYSLSVMSRVEGQEPKITEMPLYYQWDSRWNFVSYGTSTIGKGGCGICSSAMVVSYWTGKSVTPPKLVEWAYIYHTPQGSSHALYAAVAEHYNLRYKDLGVSKESMVDELKKGHTVIASMGPGEFTSNSHLIVLRTIEKGKIRVNDPNDNSNKNHANKKYTPSAIHSEAKHYWSIYK